MADDEVDLLSEIFIRILQLEEKQKQTEGELNSCPQLPSNATRITDLINVLKSNCEVLGQELMNKSVAKKLKAKEDFMKSLEVEKKKDEVNKGEEIQEPLDTLQEDRRHFTTAFNAALEAITTDTYSDAVAGLESLRSLFSWAIFGQTKPDTVCVALVRSKLEQLLSGCTKQLTNYTKAYQQSVINASGKTVVTQLIMFDAELLKTILNNAPLFELSRTLTPQLLSDLIEAMLPFTAFYENVAKTFSNYYECFAVKLAFDLLELPASDDGDDEMIRLPVVEPSTLVLHSLKCV